MSGWLRPTLVMSIPWGALRHQSICGLGVTLSPSFAYYNDLNSSSPSASNGHLGLNLDFFTSSTHSIQFSENVSDAVFSWRTDEGTSFSADTTRGRPSESGRIYGFTGYQFNEIRITTPSSSGVFTLDNLQFSTVSAIPILSPLPLFGTGLAIFGLIGWRRKRQSS